VPPEGVTLLKRPDRSSVAESPPDFRLLETIGWTPESGFALLSRHLARLRASAECFGFDYDAADVLTLLDIAVTDLSGPAKVRVLVQRHGAVVCEGMHLPPAPARPVAVALAPEPIDPDNVFLYHKTTRRDVYDAARAARPDVDAVLLWTASGEVTEATEANVVVELDGRKVTPPVACGLLGGTLRAELLETGAIIEQRVRVSDLQRATGLWLINSVRGWMKAALPLVLGS
jgi:branched-subunit amino acid aminotransferase/4-amino-4-deoxychorismate lyase